MDFERPSVTKIAADVNSGRQGAVATESLAPIATCETI